MIQALLDYYRLPANLVGGISSTPGSASGVSGFFQFGAKNICYGRNRSGVAVDVAGSGQFDASKDVRRDGQVVGEVQLLVDKDDAVVECFADAGRDRIEAARGVDGIPQGDRDRRGVDRRADRDGVRLLSDAEP